MSDDPRSPRGNSGSFFQEPGSSSASRLRVRQDSFSSEKTSPAISTVRESAKSGGDIPRVSPSEPSVIPSGETAPVLATVDETPEYDGDPQRQDPATVDENPFPHFFPRDRESALARLSTAPLSALLPRLGDLAPLVAASASFEGRLRLLHAQVERRATEERLRSIAAEEGMINQTLQWLSLQGGVEHAEGEFEYGEQELISLYELGRLYYEVGYYGPGERIFSGIVAIRPNWGAARLGSGVVKLERGLFEEAASHFRVALKDSSSQAEAKVGLSAVFLARGETERAASMLADIRREIDSPNTREEVRFLWRALARRCSSDPNALSS